ncbi:hypothetical protein [Falsiroseomonas ponticola]|uniref:hypothetical protein n=1 Tax=Falsiroseomonas ponticola TaxID=2786951 RepID=UPI0019316B66|nr:hypothetical protein [Roseomonas ponticola]
MPDTFPAAGRDIVFVIERAQQRAGSAHLRGRQLASLFAQVAVDYGRRVRVAFSDEPIAGAVAIVNKSALMPKPQDVVARLKAAGCTVLVDFVDRRVTAADGNLADGFLAVSALQYRHLRATWPDKPVIHLPHHVDLDLWPVACQWDHFACAYFGNLDNAAHLGAVRDAGLVTTIETLTANKNHWFEQLPAYNLHYAFRPRALWGAGFKPFTKGFTAAHAGAIAVIADDDEEATGLLGTDYPFQIPASADADTVIDHLHAIRDSFGNAAWRTARLRMRRLRTISSAPYLLDLIRASAFEVGLHEGVFA